MDKKKILHWSPRIGSLFFLFLFIFGVFESLRNNPGTLEIIFSLILTLIIIFIVILSWKFEYFGGVFFILFGFYYLFLVHNLARRSFLYFGIVSLITGIMFIVHKIYTRSAKINL